METSQPIALANLPTPNQRVYEPIDSENGEIRLVELLPGQYDDVIQLNLHVKNLNDDIVYDALSYTWGTINSSHRAVVNGCPVSVREILGLGLRRLRHIDQPRILWIDALSINQGDTQEKSHQVQHMAKIYKSARKVVIWLGEWPESSMCPNPEGCQALWTRVIITCSENPDFRKYDIYDRLHEVCTASGHFYSHIMNVCDRGWFWRLWSIQEVALASSNPEVLLGHLVIDCHLLFTALEWCILNSERRSGTTVYSRHQYEQIHLLNNLRLKNTYAPGLFHCMAMSRSAGVTEPKDRVYGLLGMCHFLVAEPIVPDYSKSLTHVLAEATTAMITEHGLMPYVVFDFPTAQLPNGDNGTPTWVLDVNEMNEFGNYEYNDFYGGLPRENLALEDIERRRRSTRLSDDLQTLYTSGRYIGTIAAITFMQDFPSEICYDFYHDVLKPKGVTPLHFCHFLNVMFDTGRSADDLIPLLLGPGCELYLEAYQEYYEKVLLVTEEGSIGFARHSNTRGIQVGDKLVSLFGNPFPFILRPTQGAAAYQMINLAYIHDCNNAWEPLFWAKRDDMWIDFAAEGCPEYAIV